MKKLNWLPSNCLYFLLTLSFLVSSCTKFDVESGSEDLSSIDLFMRNLSPIENLEATVLSSTDVALTWLDSNKGNYDIIIERSTDISNGFEIVAVLNRRDSVFRDSNLLPQTTYYYRLVASHRKADSPYSNIISVVTLGNLPPVAAAGGPYSGEVGQGIVFDAGNSSDPDNNIVEYSWDFGDGANESLLSPSIMHIYQTAGSYTATLTVTDSFGLTSQSQTTVEVFAINLPPIANAGGPYTGRVGTSIVFNGSLSVDSDGIIVAYFWDFGDGSTANELNPTASYAYSTAGTYEVSLTVTDDKGAFHKAKTTAVIENANMAPIANAGGPYSGIVNQPLSFDGSGSSDLDGNIVRYDWNYGDGNTGTSTLPIISHSYSQAGSYNVTLTVTDDKGATGTNSTTTNIGAENKPPIANTGGPYSGIAGQSVSLDGSGSSDPDGSIARYDWNFGDGSTGTSTSPSISHIYKNQGSFNISLTVTDDKGERATATTTAMIIPANVPPSANAGGPYTTVAGESLTLDGSGSSDPDGNIVSYFWTFGDGITAMETSSTTSHTYTTAGTFQVSLTVTDDKGATSSANSTVTVTAANVAPSANAGGPYQSEVGQALTLNASSSSDLDGNIIRYDWKFGDGNIGTSTTPTIVHTYQIAGTFNVSLTVIDDKGATGSATTLATIAALNVAPVANAGGPYEGTAGESLTFDGSGSSDPDGQIVSYEWDFGDGVVETVNTSAVSHIYSQTGIYNVTLKVTDDKGAINLNTTTVTIGEGLAPGINSYKNSVYQITRRDCAGCHSSSPFLPNHASPDLQVAYDTSKLLTDFTTLTNSRLYVKVQDNHCGSALICGKDGTEMLAALQVWANGESMEENPDPNPSPEPDTSELTMDRQIPNLSMNSFTTISRSLSGIGGLTDGTFMIDMLLYDDGHYLLANPRIQAGSTGVRVRDMRVHINGSEDTEITTYKAIDTLVPAGSLMGLLEEGASGPSYPRIRTLGSDTISFHFTVINSN